MVRSDSPDMKPVDLPVVGAPTERADAARNRQRILVAEDRLVGRNGVASTSMDAIAAEARVGTGTLFRRFGDCASLALAVLPERTFQDAFIRGPAPLDPGAPARDRLIAFGRSLLQHLSAHGDLLLAAQTARTKRSRLESGPYRAHASMLIREAASDLDASHTADALLAPLGAEVVFHQLDQPGITVDRLTSGWETIVHRLMLYPTRDPCRERAWELGRDGSGRLSRDGDPPSLRGPSAAPRRSRPSLDRGLGEAAAHRCSRAEDPQQATTNQEKRCTY